MRRTLISGLLLVAAAFLTVLLGDWLDLDVATVALLGVAAGAVVALVPDAGIGRRLAGFGLGILITLVGYVVRAAVLPDTTGGRAVFAALVVGLCVVAAAASLGRLSLWSGLLGAATFAGAFEATYNLAPPRVVENATNTLTALVLCIAVGFAAASLGAPARERAAEPTPRRDEVLEDAK